MKKIEEVDAKYLDFEGYEELLEYRKKVEQGSEENCETRYYRVSKSYEDMGF